MEDLTTHGELFDRARSISEKLARYADVERRYRELEAELRDLEQDADVRRALGLPVEVDDPVATPAPGAGEPSGAEKPAEEAQQATEVVNGRWTIPMSPGGRIQRGFLGGVFKEISEERFDRELTVKEMCSILSEELGVDVPRSSVQSLVKRAEDAGDMWIVSGSSPKRFRTKRLAMRESSVPLERFEGLLENEKEEVIS